MNRVNKLFAPRRRILATRWQSFQDLAQRDGASRAILQQENMRVMKTMPTRSKSGFIALFTAIIISVILIIVSISLNRGGYLTRGETLDAEYKNRSLALAEACLDMAMLKLANNPTYVGGETGLAVGSDECAIGAVSAGGFQYTINTSAVFPDASVWSQGAVTKLNVVVNSADFSLVSWVEVP